MSDTNENKNQYQSDDYDAITRWSKSFVFYPEEINLFRVLHERRAPYAL